MGRGHVGQILNHLLGVFCFTSAGLAPEWDRRVETLTRKHMLQTNKQKKKIGKNQHKQKLLAEKIFLKKKWTSKR